MEEAPRIIDWLGLWSLVLGFWSLALDPSGLGALFHPWHTETKDPKTKDPNRMTLFQE